MKKATLLLLLLLLMAITGYSTNYMNLMCTIYEGQSYDDLGNGIAALDFNGDGYDDLAVLQRMWVPDSLISSLPWVAYGRLLFYYGGPGFDNVADFTISGTYNWHIGQNPFSSYLVSLGDVNGDSCDDLGCRGFTDWTGGVSEDARPYIAVYFGGQNPSSQPWYYKVFPSPHSGGYAEIDPLGDINNDGYDDFSYVYSPNDSYDELSKSAFILGGSMTEVIWRQFSNDDYSTFSPAGDVNHDGFDDYICTYAHLDIKSNTLYFGTANILPADSLVLYSSQINTFTYKTNPLGDVNGDGKDDFTGLMQYPYLYVWYGNENLTSQFNFTLTPSWSGTGNSGRGLVHGDLNNDGYEDVIGSSPLADGARGAFRIWLGGANMNGTSDLTISGTFYTQMGTSMAAGDFNGDSYCDVAAASPHDEAFSGTPGRVFVFAGNAQLADTTVENEDPTITSNVNDITLLIYPNPVNKRVNELHFKLEGEIKDIKYPVICLYNVKGQLITRHKLTSDDMHSKTGIIYHGKLKSGTYIAALNDNQTRIAISKITVK